MLTKTQPIFSLRYWSSILQRTLLVAILVCNCFILHAQQNDATFNPPDFGFNNGSQFNSSVFALALQSDGKVIAGGQFRAFDGETPNYIARLNGDGSYDNSFNAGTSLNAKVNCLALQPDGKIIAGGMFTGASCNRIIRLNSDGSVDAGFNPGTGFNNAVNAIALQTDGKIIVGGSFTSFNGTGRNYIARLNSDGSLDVTFDPGTGFSTTVNSLALQPDGKVIAGGNFTSFNGTSCNRIARINIDGSLDATFNMGTGFNNIVYALALQPDGKVLAGGTFDSFNGTFRRRVARINSDGSLDASFDAGSVFLAIHCLALRPDGKLLAGGTFTTVNGTSRNRIAQLNSDGSLDAGFDPGIGCNNSVYSFAIQPDEKVITGGGFDSFNIIGINNICRINSDGSFDASFVLPGTGFNDDVESITLQPDGKILVGGAFSSFNGVWRNRIARLQSDGLIDLTFDPGAGFDGSVTAMVIQPDDKIITAGGFFRFNGTLLRNIARLNSDGSLDPTFNPGTGFGTMVNSLALQPDGKVIAGGNFSSFNGTSRNRITRINSDGSLDATFNVGTGFNNQVYALALQPDGKVIVGGLFTSYNGSACNRIVRLNADGTLDASFNPGTGFNNDVRCLVLQPDGKIIVGGSFSSFNGTARNGLVRLNSDGSLDASFNIGVGLIGILDELVIQSNGQVIAGGNFTYYNNYNRKNIVRINSDGSLDIDFHPQISFDNVIYALVLQPDEKIVTGGAFLSYNNIGRNRIARLDPNISLPVELIYFKALTESNRIKLQWATATEINNDYFIVEKSSNGIDFYPIGEIKGHGNSKDVIYYEFTDTDLYAGISYYRLKQADMDGKETYSNTEVVNLEAEGQVNLMLNPDEKTIFITLSDIKTTQVKIQLIDEMGRLVYKNVTAINDNEVATSLKLDLLPFNTGLYLLSITTDDNVYIKKLIKR